MDQSFTQRLGRTVRQLLLACLNATLILVIIALFLALRLSGAVERLTETAISAAGDQLAELAPLRGEASELRAEFAELRSDIAALSDDSGAQVAQAADAVVEKLTEIEASIDELNNTLSAASDAAKQDPGRLIERAVVTALAETGEWIAEKAQERLPEDR